MSEAGEPSLQIWRISDGSLLELVYHDGLIFWIDRQGQNIWAKWPDALTMDDVAAYLLGPVLGFCCSCAAPLVCTRAQSHLENTPSRLPAGIEPENPRLPPHLHGEVTR